VSATRTRLAGTRLLLSMVLTLVATVGLTAVPAAAQTTPRGFDAVTTQWENGRWKHLGLKRDRYIIFDDWFVYEQGVIRNKWPFLPSAFHTDLDAAAVVIDGRSWRYVFVKDDQIITFNDGGIINNIRFPSFPDSVRRNMDALTVYWFDRVQAYAVTQGESLYSFIPGVGFGGPFQVPSFVPPEFRSNFDDISFEKEGDGVKVSIYKGYGRYIYYDSIFGSDFEVERLDVRNKWPHLSSFFNTTA
jgi:hypothetical protein